MRTVDAARLLEPDRASLSAPAMTREQFAREKSFRAAMAVARSLHEQGLITGAEMKRMKRFFAHKFSPMWGHL